MTVTAFPKLVPVTSLNLIAIYIKFQPLQLLFKFSLLANENVSKNVRNEYTLVQKFDIYNFLQTSKN